ncbi:MAG: flagellar hook-basal body complex protein FliE [Firmicutes bacterium]|nr:flagellar hook-basal body complex protein FliE [Bacillota bacterium]
MKIDGNLSSITDIDYKKEKVTVTPSGYGFETFFNAAVDLYNETNKYQINAEKMQLDYISGKTDDMIGLNMALVKASSSLQFTTQVTNKMLSAYQEIMRMQI